MERPWLKNYPAGVAPHIDIPPVPAYHDLFEQIEQHPDRVALIFLDKKITFKELGAAIDRFAAAVLARYGLKPGDRLGIILPNCPQNVIATVGAQRAGLIPVQFNPMYVTREIEYQAKDSGCRAIVTLDLFWPKVFEAKAFEHYIVTSVADYLPWPKNWLYPLKFKPPKPPAGAATLWKELMATPAPAFTPAAVAKPADEPSVLLYTGGTTGVSKGVVLTHTNFVANIRQIKAWLDPENTNEHQTVVVVLPMFHSYGFTAALGFALASGSTCLLVPKFDPKEILGIIQKYRPGSFPGVPTIYTALLNEPDLAKYDLKSIRTCVSGAAPLPVELMKRFEQVTGATILEGFGLTETSPVTHSNPLNGVRKPGSVGLPYPNTDVRIVDLETGADLPLGQEGEVLLKGPQVMKGYWNKPEETAAILKDGWLFTGDIGKMDDEGYLYIVDRKKDMIIAGGFNVYPREIDEVLVSHPAVQESATIGVPDEYRGETVKSFVVLKPGQTATEQELLDFCKTRLAAYKRPRLIEFLPALPKSNVGKVLRRELRAQETAKLQKLAAARQ